MFVGDKAAPNIPGASEQLGQARAEESGGGHMPAIFASTGWFKGPDGQWRREVPDKDMEFTGKLKKGAGAIPLDQAIKHDELFKAAPGLRDVTIEADTISLNRTHRPNTILATNTSF
jgi:hypothetical protein